MLFLSQTSDFKILSENSEYDEAKNEQGLIESRIAEIEQTLAHAIILDDDEISTEKVGIGNIVTILDIEMEEEMTFQIVGTVGETVTAEAPSGEIQFKILNITKKEEE